ncbi:acetyl-CoA synthetase-like protein [Aureobasidium pullulans]|uniref:Very long-chain fatty acid transport protein n=1 Tax=Aureobasidium pullulans TaxID=5580 RepID=A0A4S9KVB6_AURPU|nr:acetyl-CoA synthetase-like protein [Aureobasidium pullulans]THW22618.1 acetyl-CoA synthetase-like protein [Aureobasidium pullulans]THW25116.1 acetyl-CoA synthetase-like protein [Aureobasidium pullulans]THW66573.1 acetyl-CoA synthetase-like protein [Aureobasidium pullulans]THX01998.1 acetyl-CoA synthetase-like protein [Aureobasidium pullulans]
MDLGTATVAGAAVAAAAYIDGKLQIRKDLRDLWNVKRAQFEWNRAVKKGEPSLWSQFEKQVQRLPSSTTCLWSKTGTYTWSETRAQACRYAEFLSTHGAQSNKPVAIYLQNSPEFMFSMLATWSLGTAPAMINYNLSGDALLHCLKISSSKVLVVDEDAGCRQRVEDVRDRIEQELGMQIIILDSSTKATIAAISPKPVDARYREHVDGETPVCLIYTSGTTGLPKASHFHLERIWFLGDYRRRLTNQTSGPNGDVFYNCMPLYHGTGGVLAAGCMASGLTLAIGRKFSTSGFWDEIRESGATAFVYVGETARYLLSAPPSSRDKDHKVRLMHGNGMRPDVWRKFQERFGVTDVMEFFNSTEGVFTLNNYSRNDHYADAVGHHGAIFRTVFHKTYVPVKLDYETGEIWRHPKTGFAQRQPYEEGGEMLVKVEDENVFKGYWNAPEATAKKYARDVFEKGDLYYRSGDALRRDRDGKWFFMDRLGDTFRWKGENCSTTEVAECLGRFPSIQEANVYGVEVPGHDGRACCAAVYIEPQDRASFDFKAFLNHNQKLLPKYAVPLFLRFVSDDQAHTMHNNKQNKTQLRREGVDPAKVANGQAGSKDVLYWLQPKGTTYEPFGETEWKRIVAGKAKL